MKAGSTGYNKAGCSLITSSLAAEHHLHRNKIQNAQHLPQTKCSAEFGDSLTCGLSLGPEREGGIQSALHMHRFHIPEFNQLKMRNYFKKMMLLLMCTI